MDYVFLGGLRLGLVKICFMLEEKLRMLGVRRCSMDTGIPYHTLNRWSRGGAKVDVSIVREWVDTQVDYVFKHRTLEALCEVVDVSAVARWIGVSRSTVNRWLTGFTPIPIAQEERMWRIVGEKIGLS